MDQIKVLVVDDELGDRFILRQQLELSDPGKYVFMECGSGADALRCQREFLPDCLLLDFNLPDIDGLAVVEKLRTQDEQLPCAVVVMTAAGCEQVAVDAMKLGVMDYLVKGPSRFDALPLAIASAIQRFRLRAELETQRLVLRRRNEELEQTRAEVVREREQYKQLTEAIPQLVWIADANGRVEYANERLQRFAIKTLAEPWALTEIVSAKDKDGFQEQWLHAVARHAPFETQVELVQDGRGHRAHLARAVPISQELRDPRWFGTFTDIEEQRRSEEALRERQKLDSIGLLAGGIAHDFNNLLVGILGGASYVRDLLEPDHPGASIVDMVIRSGERAAQLTQQLLAYAGKSHPVLEGVDVVQLVRDTCDLVMATAPRRIRLSMEIDPQLPALEANPSQLQQVLMNLVLNATEAIQEEDGTVSIRAALVSVAPGQEVPNRLGYEIEHGRYLEVTVADTGMGMDEATAALIFDPFFTTKFTGRGLGLAAVQGIIRSERGTIQVTSSPGQGSTFRVLLPAKLAHAPEILAQQGMSAPDRFTVLVIEDEQMVRATTSLLLKREGYQVLEAHNGPDGLAEYRENAEAIDVVLLDLKMPGMSGVQVLAELRKISPDVPVIIISGYSEEEIVGQYGRLPIAGFVQKPFVGRSLVNSLAAIRSRGPHRASLGLKAAL